MLTSKCYWWNRWWHRIWREINRLFLIRWIQEEGIKHSLTAEHILGAIKIAKSKEKHWCCECARQETQNANT